MANETRERLAVQHAARVLAERGRLLLALLEEREAVLGQIAGLGGAAQVESLPEIKAAETRLRALDEALGLLRYG